MERLPNHVVYRLVRRNVRDLVIDLPEAGDLPVPACPDWRVRDLVAHLLDICEQAIEMVNGRASGPVRTDPPPGERPKLSELLDRWEERGAELDRLVADTGDPRSDMLTHDAFCHEMDLRVAVGAPWPAGHPGYTSLLPVPIRGFLARIDELGLPVLRIETPGGRWTSGAGEPAAVLSAGRHDLYRSITGRRTHDQIAALSWSGDPAPWLPAFTRGPFRPPERPAEDLVHA